jgi:hypothetical protein
MDYSFNHRFKMLTHSIRNRNWNTCDALRALLYAAGLAIILAATPASAAKACKKTIKACGCVAKKPGHYVLANDLTSSSTGADCLTIAGAHVSLDMAGHIMTGPGGAATGAGIHVLASGNGAFIDGVNQTIGGFGTGILVEASDVVMAFVLLDSNAQFGLKIDGGSRNSIYNSSIGKRSDATTGNGTAGVLINNGTGNLIDDVEAAHNGSYGIEISGGSNNAIHDSDGDANGIYGIWINGSNGNRVVFSTGNSNAGLGLYIGCAPMGGPASPCPSLVTGSSNVVDHSDFKFNTNKGVGVDAGDLANQIGLNNIITNGGSDAADENTNCGTNLWFLDNIGKPPGQACIK